MLGQDSARVAVETERMVQAAYDLDEVRRDAVLEAMGASWQHAMAVDTKPADQLICPGQARRTSSSSVCMSSSVVR